MDIYLSLLEPTKPTATPMEIVQVFLNAYGPVAETMRNINMETNPVSETQTPDRRYPVRSQNVDKLHDNGM